MEEISSRDRISSAGENQDADGQGTRRASADGAAEGCGSRGTNADDADDADEEEDPPEHRMPLSPRRHSSPTRGL